MDTEKLTRTALKSVKETLAHEADALANLCNQYNEDVDSQLEIARALRIFYEIHSRGGKIVACGIGKLYKIATKTVATLKSLSIAADVLHPAEALHGDLGLLNARDVVIYFSASGNTPELIGLLTHFPPSVPVVLLTCTRDSPLARHPQVQCVLLTYLPDHLKENTVHGIPAPTISTTLALCLADAVVLALAEMIECDIQKRKKLFSMKHPGGSIGSDLSHLNDNLVREQTLDSKDSYALMLSLNQVRMCFRSRSMDEDNVSSLASSDSEDQLKGPSRLTFGVQNALPDQTFRSLKADLLLWSETDLLKTVVNFDFIVYSEDGKNFARESSKIRNIYKKEGFTNMESILACFERITLLD